MPSYSGNPTIQQVDTHSQPPLTYQPTSQPFTVTTTEAANTWMGFQSSDQFYNSTGDGLNTE
jgi:hypothetical protein